MRKENVQCTEPMKVLMIGLYPPHVGGIATYIYNLRKALQALQIKVYVLTYGRARTPGVYGTNTLDSLRGVSFLISGVHKTHQIIKKEDIDILHAHYLVPPGLVGVLSTHLCKKPLVVTCHGSDLFVFSRGWRKILSRHVIHNADRIVCNSKATLEIACALDNPSSVTYIPSGVDLERFNPLDLKRKAITYVGALTPVKGVDTFLRAMKDTDHLVWIVGDGPQRNYLENLAKSLGLNCVFWGFRTDIPQLMNRSRVVVLPSRHEGFGLTLLEAMACETPVIARNTGGIPELINGKNGLLFETEQELSRKIENLLKDDNLYKTLQKKGLKTALQWSWERTAQQYAHLYSTL